MEEKLISELKKDAYESIRNSDLQRAFENDINSRLESSRSFPIKKGPYLIRRAFWELSKKLNAPIELVAGDMLAAVSGSYQFNVEISHRDSIFGLNIYLINMLPSGGGKSKSKNETHEPLTSYQQQLDTEYYQELADYNSKMELWNVKKRRMKKSFEKGENSEGEFSEFLKTEPEKPLRVSYLETDFTMPAVVSSLNVYPFMVVIDDEGLRLACTFNNDLYTWTSFWDGSPVYKNIKSEGRISLPKIGVVISVSAQTEPMLEYIDKNMEKIIASGFSGRTLMSVAEPVLHEESSVVHSQMETPCYAILKANIEAGLKQKEGRVLRFSLEAEAHLKALTIHYQQMCDQLESAEELDPLLRRATQHILKLSANAHLLVHGTESDEIGIEYVQYGHDLFEYYLQQARYIFTDERIHANLKANAKQLWDWLQEITKDANISRINHSKYYTIESTQYDFRNTKYYCVVRLTTIMQYAPKKFRKANILNELLDEIARREHELNVKHSHEQNAKCVYIETAVNYRFGKSKKDPWID